MLDGLIEQLLLLKRLRLPQVATPLPPGDHVSVGSNVTVPRFGGVQPTLKGCQPGARSLFASRYAERPPMTSFALAYPIARSVAAESAPRLFALQ